MHELCILYHFHATDEITLQHFELLRELNPEAAIVPLTTESAATLPGSVNVAELSSRWDTSEQWRSLDSLFYTWFLHRTVTAERYVLMEYDCRCTAPLREAYGAVWDAQVACRSFYTPDGKPDWYWFRREELDRLPAEDRPFAGGVVPYACALFSHEAAERLVACASNEDVFCELRLGTAILRAGLEPVEFPSPLRDGVFATPTEIDMGRPGVFHPVKAREIHERNLRQRREAETGLWARLRRRLRS